MELTTDSNTVMGTFALVSGQSPFAFRGV